MPISPLPRLILLCVTVALPRMVAAAEGHGSPPIRHDAAVANRQPLQPTPLVRLPLGSVRPTGWLRRQLDLQRDGLTGHAEAIYEELGPDSAWLGGGGGGVDWERGPYYVKGLIALAHTLDDPILIERAEKWVDWVLNSQRQDGFFGPTTNDDWWPRMVVLYYLRDHYEATGDERVLPFLTAYFRHQLDHLPDRPLSDWGKARAGDNIDVVLWTYNRTGEPFLLELAELLREQAYPWRDIFTNDQFYGRFEEFHPHHIVNVSQAIKFPAVAWQLTGEDADRDALAAGLEHLYRRYGRIDGQLSGTEMLSGRAQHRWRRAVCRRGADPLGRNQRDRIRRRGAGRLDGGDRLQLAAGPHDAGPDGHHLLPASQPGRLHPRRARLRAGLRRRQPARPAQRLSVLLLQLAHRLAQARPEPLGRHPPTAGWRPWRTGRAVSRRSSPTACRSSLSRRLNTRSASPSRCTSTPSGRRPSRCSCGCLGGATPLKSASTARRSQMALRQAFSSASSGRGGLAIASDLTFPMEVRTLTWVNGSTGVRRGPLAYVLEIGERWEKATDHEGAVRRVGNPAGVGLEHRARIK